MAEARAIADQTRVYDNNSARKPFRLVATYERGTAIGSTTWPVWTPAALR